MGRVPAEPHRLSLHAAARAQVDFLVTAHGLTLVERVNRLLDGSRSETSAEHSWHLALTALVLAPEHGPQLDLEQVLTMLLVHDLVEVDAGDVPIYDTQAREAIEEVERAAAQRLFGLLPPEQGERLRAAWDAFEAAATPEARFARAVDRMQPMLVHWAGDGAAWAQRGITVAQERAFVEMITAWWPSLGPVAAAIVDDAVERGMLVEGD
jgi:putative hydrolase of HD superfamily